MSKINIKGVPYQRFLGTVKKSPYLDVFKITGFLPTLGSFVIAGYKYGVLLTFINSLKLTLVC